MSNDEKGYELKLPMAEESDLPWSVDHGKYVGHIDLPFLDEENDIVPFDLTPEETDVTNSISTEFTNNHQGLLESDYDQSNDEENKDKDLNSQEDEFKKAERSNKTVNLHVDQGVIMAPFPISLEANPASSNVVIDILQYKPTKTLKFIETKGYCELDEPYILQDDFYPKIENVNVESI